MQPRAGLRPSCLTLGTARAVQEWNLNCVGFLDIPEAAYVPPVGPDTFYDVDGETLRILGDVEEGFAIKVFKALAENPQVSTVALGSGGGYVAEALLAGRAIQMAGKDTVLYDTCSSACTLVFLGGVNRQIWSPYPKLGFHQASRLGSPVSPADPVYGEIRVYAEQMGVPPDPILAFMMAAHPSEMHYPEMMQLCEAGVTTWIQRLCF